MASCTAFFTFSSCSWLAVVWTRPLSPGGSTQTCDQDIVTRVQSLRHGGKCWHHAACKQKKNADPTVHPLQWEQIKQALLDKKSTVESWRCNVWVTTRRKTNCVLLLLELASGYSSEPGMFVTCQCQFTSMSTGTVSIGLIWHSLL